MGLAAGIHAAGGLPGLVPPLLAVAAVAAGLVFLRRGWRGPGLVLLAAALGLLRAPALPAQADPPPGIWRVEGRLLDHARATESGWRLLVGVNAMVPVAGDPVAAGPPRRVPRRILVDAPAGAGPPPAWPARVRVTGRLLPLPGYRNPGLPGYGEYLRRLGYAHRLSGATPPEVAAGPLARGAAVLRWRAREAFRRGAGPAAGVLEALALGSSAALSPEQREALAGAGLAHAVAASGMHLGVLAWAVAAAVRGRLTPRAEAAVVAATAAGFVLLAGPVPSLLRAAAMLGAFRLLRAAARPPDGLNVLGAAAAALLLVDPAALYDVGFRLSVLAVAGLIVAAPAELRLVEEPPQPLARLLLRRLGRGALRLAAASAAAQLAALPVLASVWGEVSAVALVANPVALPLLVALLPPALAVVLLAGVSPAVAAGMAALLAPAASAVGRVAALLAGLPGARLPLPSPGPWGTACYYAALAVLLGDWRHTVERRRRPVPQRPEAWAGAVLVAAGLVVGTTAARQPRALEVTFLDAGQGDAVVLRVTPGLTAVVDAGESPSGRPLGAERALVPYLRSLGVRRVDLAVATHYDADHAAGLAALAERLPVRRLLLPGDQAIADASDLELAERLGRLPQARAAPGSPATLRFGDAVVEVLTPPGPGLRGNDASLALRLCFGGRGVLLTGDAGTAREEEWVRQGTAVRADVLKVGHHGSRTATGPRFLARVRPAVAVIQVGRANRYGHPSPEVLARLAAAGVTVYRTDRDGGVVIRIRRDGTTLARTAGAGWRRLLGETLGPGGAGAAGSRCP